MEFFKVIGIIILYAIYSVVYYTVMFLLFGAVAWLLLFVVDLVFKTSYAPAYSAWLQKAGKFGQQEEAVEPEVVEPEVVKPADYSWRNA